MTQGKPTPSILQFAGWGLFIAMCVGGGMAGGWFVDQALGTLPVFLFLGLLAGVGAGVWVTRAEYKRFS